MIKKNRGFTLIEVMITVTILGTLTVLVAQAIQQSIKTKTKMQGQLEDVSHMRDAVRLIERDVNQAYHYRDVEKELSDLLKKKNQSGTTPDPATMTPEQQAQQAMKEQQEQQQYLQQQAAREVPRRDPETHFVGTNDTLNFVTMNNARTVRNTKQADFVEVGYELKECRSLQENGGTSKCVWRRSSPYVDLDVTKGGDEVVLLENVSEFKFRYLGKGKQDWVNDWRTDAQGDGATKGKFPQAVELSVTVLKKTNGKERKYSMQVIIPLHFPNNPEESSNAQSSQTLTQ
ncbi:MAG: prepilin-type N-terminal cleavage/methylation domain-containing protein [Bdellovibrio sp.]|nr:prepilin-type N-terminal cleavage/methylation domain-containing protein [Bdellovibrio sp.]